MRNSASRHFIMHNNGFGGKVMPEKMKYEYC